MSSASHWGTGAARGSRDMTTEVSNGVNVQALLDAREVLRGAPEAAQFTWRASSRWQDGVHSTTRIQNYFGLAQEQSHTGETEHTTTVVIGAGHAGLAASHFLRDRSIDHVVLERGEVANSWRRERWDSLRLLTPNWQCRLPGRHGYDGPDPDGYLTMGEVTE